MQGDTEGRSRAEEWKRARKRRWQMSTEPEEKKKMDRIEAQVEDSRSLNSVILSSDVKNVRMRGSNGDRTTGYTTGTGTAVFETEDEIELKLNVEAEYVSELDVTLVSLNYSKCEERETHGMVLDGKRNRCYIRNYLEERF